MIRIPILAVIGLLGTAVSLTTCIGGGGERAAVTTPATAHARPMAISSTCPTLPACPTCECPKCPAPRALPCRAPAAHAVANFPIRVVIEGCPPGLVCIDYDGQIELIKRLGVCEER